LLRDAVPNGTRLAPQIARLSPQTFPAGDLFPGAYVKGFDEVWSAVLGTWDSSRHDKGPAQDQDRWQVETHLLLKRDYVITARLRDHERPSPNPDVRQDPQ
jgi:hypothetical protein